MNNNNCENRGILYIVPTPIGNLGDMTFRAVEILKSVALIGAEDTRQSAVLLKHYQIETPMISYHKFNEKSRLEQLLSNLKLGKDIAIISDAGTPGISDPAAILIREAIKNNIPVSTLPGAAAFLPALVSSGFDTERFLFSGFLPVKEKDKKALLQEIAPLQMTLIFYEAPHRLISFLQTLHENLGDRDIVIGRELTKRFETFYRNRLSYFIEHQDTIKLKGEITVVCKGAARPAAIPDSEILKNLKEYMSRGETKSFAINRVSKDLKVPKNRVYALAHDSNVTNT
jgi:16S rRNA (cytidine1402-2'-O)-methyltransferase